MINLVAVFPWWSVLDPCPPRRIGATGRDLVERPSQLSQRAVSVRTNSPARDLVTLPAFDFDTAGCG